MEDKIRRISAGCVEETVKDLLIEVNRRLPSDAVECIHHAKCAETNALAQQVLTTLCDNLSAAENMGVPICQDTGMAVIFAEVGQNVHVEGASLAEAINRGCARAYVEGAMRCSVVSDPLYDRKNTNDNTPAILHITAVPGDQLRITVAPKGFGSENMSQLRMMTPAATEEDVVNFVVESVKRAGSNPCPPILVGVGIGGDFEQCALLAKRALVRDVSDTNEDPRYAALETKILERINLLGIGPQGFGGDTTAFAVKVEHAPTHIAGLPVAVNINCHVMRHATKVV